VGDALRECARSPRCLTREAVAEVNHADVEVTFEAQASGLGAPGSHGTQFETYLVWAITPAGKAFKLGAMEAKGNRFELNAKSAVPHAVLSLSNFGKTVPDKSSVPEAYSHRVRQIGPILKPCSPVL
jgi:hypothetical protein